MALLNRKVRWFYAPAKISHDDHRLATSKTRSKAPLHTKACETSGGHLVGDNVPPALLLHVGPEQRGVDGLRHPAHVRQRSDRRQIANNNLSMNSPAEAIDQAFGWDGEGS